MTCPECHSSSAVHYSRADRVWLCSYCEIAWDG